MQYLTNLCTRFCCINSLTDIESLNQYEMNCTTNDSFNILGDGYENDFIIEINDIPRITEIKFNSIKMRYFINIWKKSIAYEKYKRNFIINKLYFIPLLVNYIEDWYKNKNESNFVIL